MKECFDLAIVGSGFGGSLLAMIARQMGRSVLLLERGTHPRFAIGESSTPLTNLLLEELATRYNLPSVTALSKWGSWQRTHPQIACGLKRGFTFVHHQLGREDAMTRERQLLVAASPHDHIADTHWYRPDFDHFLVQEAERHGVVYRDRVELKQFEEHQDHVVLRSDAEGFTARFVVDATGPRGFLHTMLGLGEETASGTQALYTHFRGVAQLPPEQWAGAPFPVDQAAVHHVFAGGWVWILRFNNGLTSAGVAMNDSTAEHLRLEAAEPAWNRLLELLPDMREQFNQATPQRPFTHVKRLSFHSASIVGERWALLPSAAGFVDPLFSTGFPLTLLGVERLTAMLRDGFTATDLAAYAQRTHAELRAAEQLIGALYATMDRFDVFTDVSMLYFAAASYSETVRRLGTPHLAASFLLHDHAEFGPASRQLVEKAAYIRSADERSAFSEAVHRTVEPINIAGLSNPARRNWYPVDAGDLLRAPYKVGANRKQIVSMLDRAGFWQPQVVSA